MRIQPSTALLASLFLGCGSDTASNGSDTSSVLADGGIAGGGSTSGGGKYTGTGFLDDASTCEAHDVDNGRVAPDILIVLDRSTSMRMRGVNRWDPSVSALKTITSSLDESVKFGLMVFPGTQQGQAMAPASCNTLTDAQQITDCITGAIGGAAGGVASCDPGTVAVPVGARTAAPIAQALDSMQPNGATPTASTLQAAHMALGSGFTNNVDVRTSAKFVLLVTDGQPNCTGGTFGGGAPGGGSDPQAVTDSVARIQEMTDDGIKTYVLGYGTQDDQGATDALNQMARAGGTGDQAYRPINDEQGLLTVFQKITGTLVTCDFQLNTAPPDASYVRVALDGTALRLDDPNGWTLSADHLHVTVQGSACEAVKSRGHSLSVRVECDKVILR
jgi:Mg-chelatase subunit ChlD